MKIPKIILKFDKLVCQTDKAYQIEYNGEKKWIPKSLTRDLRINGKVLLNGSAGNGTVCISPFKWQEVTGIIPQSLNEFSINNSDVQENNTIKDYDIIELPNYSLYKEQIDTVVKLKRMRLFCLNGQMRVGKTVILGTIAYSRFISNIINKLIVIAPLRTKATWHKHIDACMPFEFYPIEHFSNEHTRDNIKIDCDKKTMVYLDESHKIKNNNVIRTDYIISQTLLSEYKGIGTGTLIGKHAGDLYWQFYFLNPEILDYSTYQYMSDAHLLYGGKEGRKVVGYTNIEEFSTKVSPYIVKLSREDLNRDRMKIKSIKKYNLSDYSIYNVFVNTYDKHYNESNRNLILKYITRMQQSCSGFIFSDEENVIDYRDNGRIKCLIDTLKELKGSTVIYFKYKKEAEAIKKVLNVPVLMGQTSQSEFDNIIERFNNGIDKIILMQQLISIGFSLKKADNIIYYSTTFDLIQRSQSEDRASEHNHKPVKIIDIVANDTIDERIQDVLSLKSDIFLTFKSQLKNESK